MQALEVQYDSASARRRDGGGTGLGGQLPSADELAAEVERFLADRDGESDETR